MSTLLSNAVRSRLHALVAPDIFDFWAGRVDPLLSWERPLARVVGRRAESADAITLDLLPNRHFAGFAAGQHINVTVEVDGVRHTRSYSPSTAPAADRRLSITIGRVDGGIVSSYLRDRVRIGDVIGLGPAFGDMTLPASPRGRWLFLAAGSGITPLMSLIRSLETDSSASIDLDLLYWSRRRDQLCFTQELRARSATDLHLRCRFVLTGEAAQSADEAEGRPSLEQLSRLVPDFADRNVFACGPSGFVETLRTQLTGRVASFHAEAFTPPTPTNTVSGTVRVTLARSGRTLELPVDRALLPSLEAQGLRPAHGCRMGLCNTCACQKISGATQHLLSGVSNREADPALRICVNRPQTDLTLDL